MLSLPFANINLKLPNGKEYYGNSNVIMPPLKKDGQYVIGFDQSTTCTGIAIARRHEGIIAVLEAESLMHGNRREYIKGLYNYVIRMMSGLDIHTFMLEDVFEGASPSTSKILKELLHILLNMRKSSAISAKRIERINNFVWKSEYFSHIEEDNKYTRENAKRLAKAISLEKYPWTAGFKEDAYDAIGIVDSFCTACYSGDWSLTPPRLINKFIYSEARHLYDFEIVTKPEESRLFTEHAQTRGVEEMAYNVDLTPTTNAYLSTAYSKKLIVAKVPQSNWHAIFCLEKRLLWKDTTDFYLVALSKYTT